MLHILYVTTLLLLQTNPWYTTSFALSSQMYPWYHHLLVMGCTEFAKMLVSFWSCTESTLASRYELGPSRMAVSLDRRNTDHRKKNGEVVSPEWPNSMDVLIACPPRTRPFGNWRHLWKSQPDGCEELTCCMDMRPLFCHNISHAEFWYTKSPHLAVHFRIKQLVSCTYHKETISALHRIHTCGWAFLACPSNVDHPRTSNLGLQSNSLYSSQTHTSLKK